MNLLIQRVIFFIYRKVYIIYETVLALFKTTYSYKKKKLEISNLTINADLLTKNKIISQSLLKNYLSHNFNLLGSGLKNVNLKKKNHEINFKNKKISFLILKQIINKNYKLIDWQSDFKSQYHWKITELSKKIKFMNIPKSDIKIPWELARMQHLPQLAIFASFIKNKNINKSKKIFEEFHDQVLDFIASNPPKFGVNWVSPMEASIRISNLLIANNIFNSMGFYFSKISQDIFMSSVEDHKNYILQNLEYSNYRNNHYLSNICGLAVIARYLPQNIHSDSLIAFVSQELNKEIFFQFNKDGSNKEGSTCYHKLSLEMLFYATSVILSFGKKRLMHLSKNKKLYLNKINIILPKLKGKIKLYKSDKLFIKKFLSPFPKKYFIQLTKIYNFFSFIVLNDNQIIQIGDNDSSKFFNFTPVFYKKKINNINKKNYFENREDCRYIFDIAESWGLTSQRQKNAIATFERNFSYLLLQGIKFTKNVAKPKSISKFENNNLVKKFYSLKSKILTNVQLKEQKYVFKINTKYENKLNTYVFSDFGLIIWKNAKIFLTLRLLTDYNKNLSSHFHLDQISNILVINNNFKIFDPGTYTYTRDHNIRNYFRSYKVHFSPISINYKQSNNIFSKINLFVPYKILLSNNCYLVKLTIDNKDYYSGFIYENNKIKIFHIYNKKYQKNQIIPKISPGYGLLIKNKNAK
jgi:hypothetical protein